MGMRGPRVLHTADWHIGRTLYTKKRYEEHEAFLGWLVETIRGREVEVLIVAGDVFDTSTPGSRAQELYYDFLHAASALCRHIVIIGGNHDSPSFLEAPRKPLEVLGVHVAGKCADDPADDVLVLENDRRVPELIVCAVPYLRDRDIRRAEPGESIEEKERKLIEGIRRRYAGAAEAARKHRDALEAEAEAEAGGALEAEAGDAPGGYIPIVAAGHLFTAGGRTVEGDGVRELYVGSLAHAPISIFPDCLDYAALGHLHVPQSVGGRENVRYSGSPLPMGFGESKQRKSVCIVDFPGGTPVVDVIDVPVFQELEAVSGDWNAISRRIFELSAANSRAWLEVSYEGDEMVSDLRGRLEESMAGTRMELLRVRDNRVIRRVLRRMDNQEALEDMDEGDVFERCLDAHRVSEDERSELRHTYGEAAASLRDEDVQAG